VNVCSYYADAIDMVLSIKHAREKPCQTST